MRTTGMEWIICARWFKCLCETSLAGNPWTNRVFGREEENRIRETLEQGGARLLDEKIYPAFAKACVESREGCRCLWFICFRPSILLCTDTIHRSS